MIIFFLISLFLLGIIAGYVAVQEQREVGLYCDQVASKINFAAMGQADPAQSISETNKQKSSEDVRIVLQNAV